MKIEQFALQDEDLIQVARALVNTDHIILAKRRAPNLAGFHNRTNKEIAMANATFGEAYKQAMMEQADVLVKVAETLRVEVAKLG